MSKPEPFVYDKDSLFDYDNVAVVATRLAQVFAIRIKHIDDGGESCEVYGKITVEDEQGPLVIYDNPIGLKSGESGDKGGTLALSCTDRSIIACSDWSINFDIEDKKGTEFIKESHRVSYSGLKSYPGKMEKGLFDRTMVINVEGKVGVANVYLCLLKVAVSTAINSKFIIRNESPNVRVFGTLHGRYGKWFDHGKDDVAEYSRVVLFDKKDDCLLLDKDCKDLFESRVAVPAYSPLILEGDFRCVYYDGTEEQIRVRKDLVTRGPGVDFLTFKGDHGEIIMNVMFCYPWGEGQFIHELTSM